MNRWLSLILGPELYWIMVYVAFRWLAVRNVPPSAAGNTTLNWAVWLAATVGVAASFALLALPNTNRWIVLVRLAVAGFIGLNAGVIVACGAIKYPEPGRDSGLMALWFLAVGVGVIVWVIGAIVSVFALRTSGSG
jgi:hypothetical protein